MKKGTIKYRMTRWLFGDAADEPEWLRFELFRMALVATITICMFAWIAAH